jgi:hypothetical protein
VFSDAVHVVFEPASSPSPPAVLPFSIAGVFHDIALPPPFASPDPATQYCFIDTSCFANALPAARAATIELSTINEDGIGSWCSATVINVNGSGDLFAVTAGHCVPRNGDGSSIIGLWGYEQQSCGAQATFDSYSLPQTHGGARILGAEHRPISDVALLVFNYLPTPEPSMFAAAGWSNELLFGVRVTSFSHPQDLAKKEASGVITQNVISNLLLGLTPNGCEFDCSDYTVSFDKGVVDHGSSGSGIFDDSQSLVGIDSLGPANQPDHVSACVYYTALEIASRGASSVVPRAGYRMFSDVYNILVSALNSGSASISEQIVAAGPVSLSATADQGDPIVNLGTVNVNVGFTGKYVYVASTSDGWLQTDANGLILVPPNGAAVNVSANAATLHAGNYNGTVTFTLAGTSKVAVVNVSLVVRPSGNVLSQRQVLPWIASGSGQWQQTILLSNPVSSSNSYQVSFFDTSGNPLPLPVNGQLVTTLSGTLAASALKAIIPIPLTASASVGWAEVLSSSPLLVTGRISNIAASGVQFDALIQSVVPSTTFAGLIPFDNSQGNVTSIAITNAGSCSCPSTTASGQLVFRDDMGTVLVSDSVAVAPRATAFALAEKYPQLAGKTGSLSVSMLGAAAAVGFVFNPTGAYSTLPVLSATAGTGKTTSMLPWIASGGGWKEDITLLNASSAASGSYTISFFDTNGQPLALNVGGVPSSTLTGLVPRNGRVSISPSQDATTKVGWARIVSDAPVLSLGRIANPQRSGILFQAATQSAVVGSSTAALPFDNAVSNITSMAITNVSDSDAGAILSAVADDGTPLLLTDFALQARSTFAFSLVDKFPQLVQRRGTIFVRSSAAVGAIGFVFNGSGSFSTIPASYAVVPSTLDYSDANQWAHVVSGPQRIDFEGIVADGQTKFIPSPPGLTRGGVTFDLIDHSGSLFVVGKGYYYPDRSVLSSQGVGGGKNATLRIMFPNNFANTAFGLEFGDISASASFKFTLSSGEVFTRTVQASKALSFFGITSFSPISSVDISMPTQGDAANFGSFSFGPWIGTAPGR